MDKHQEILNQLEAKFTGMGQDLQIHLEGLLYNTPITYWDYIQTDALLNLQVKRTSLPDEMIFIMYHQINELLFKMTLWEIDQIAAKPQSDPKFFAEKMVRMANYFDVLSSSFSIMGKGMSKEQYLKFRTTLTPASGFQSAQYRFIEFASTDWQNLADVRFRSTIGNQSTVDEAYEHLYWHAAGKDYATGKKSTLITLFEDRYKDEFYRRMLNYRQTNVWARYCEMSEEAKQDATLIKAMRKYDKAVNIDWVMAHFHAAEAYLDNEGQEVQGTGGSAWKRYMHPSYQRRIFFPGLWLEEELANWGKDA